MTTTQQFIEEQVEEFDMRMNELIAYAANQDKDISGSKGRLGGLFLKALTTLAERVREEERDMIIEELKRIVQPNEDRADFMGDDYVDIDRDLQKFLQSLSPTSKEQE